MGRGRQADGCRDVERAEHTIAFFISQPASRETDRARPRESRIGRAPRRVDRCAARRGSRGTGPRSRGREASPRRSQGRGRTWRRRRPDRVLIASTPKPRGVPMMGPSPSMPTMPSTMVRPGRTVATRSTMELSMPCCVQHVLRPAVHRAGHDAEQVLHRAGHAGPVVGLQLRHRHDQVRVAATDAGSAIRPIPLKLLASSRHSTSSVLRSTKRMRCSRR